METSFHLLKSKGSNPLDWANSKKKVLRFSTSCQNPFGLRGGCCVDGRIEGTEEFETVNTSFCTLKRKGFLLPLRMGFCSFQLLTTSSHCKSDLKRWRVGNLGFLVANKYPWCLKVTISPSWGSHLFANSDDPAGALNRTPFGLCNWIFWAKEVRGGRGEMMGWEIANGNILWYHTYNSHSHCWYEIFPIIRASPSRNFCCVPSDVRGKKKEGGDKANKETYLVFEIGGGAAWLKGRFGVSQDDSFSSSINHILEEGLQVRSISTHHFICNANIFAWMFLHVFNWKKKP